MELERIMEMMDKKAWNFSELEFIKWLIERDDTYKALIAKLEEHQDKMSDSMGVYEARIAELEGELALLKAGSVIQLFHPDGCLCDICDNRLEEDK